MAKRGQQPTTKNESEAQMETKPVEVQTSVAKPVEAPKAHEAPKLEPLTAEEREQLADLETRARKGRQILQPTPADMVTLGKLRARSKAV